MRNEELIERLARDAYILDPEQDGEVGVLWDDLPAHDRECAVKFVRNALTTLRDLGPSEEMRDAGCLPLESCGFVHNPEPAFTAMLTSLLGDPR